MLISNSNAFDKITDPVNASLQKLSDISKFRFNFFSTVFELQAVKEHIFGSSHNLLNNLVNLLNI